MNRKDKATFDRLTVADVEAAICEQEPSHYQDHQDWAQDCHSVSLSIVRSGLFEQARVARGACRGVGGQHSWVVLGNDCYDPKAPILDATLWSYAPQHPVLWKGSLKDGLHTPHGSGVIWQWGKPVHHGGETVHLDTEGLSSAAVRFLDMVGPLDGRGWSQLFMAPVGGWPAAEIIERASQTSLSPYIPIDILGMLTDLNPDGLYLPEQKQEA